MNNIINRVAYSFVIWLILVTPLLAQDSAKIVVLSQRVGETIDRAQRDQFRIFQRFNDFEYAQVLWRLDSTFFVRIALRGSDGLRRDTTFDCSEIIVFSMAERIRHFEQLSEGTYTVGSDTIVLRTADGELIKRSGIHRAVNEQQTYQQLPSDLLPIAPGAMDEDLMLGSVSVGLGLGISRYSPDYSGLVYAYREIEQGDQTPGYTVQSHDPDFSASGILWLNFRIRLTSAFAILAEAGTQMGGDANVKSAAFSLAYSYRDLSLLGFHPYVAAGICKYSISVEERYDVYISQYVSLDAVTIDAANLGAQALLGLETGGRSPFDLHLGYAYIPAVTRSVSQGREAKIDLSSLLFGVRFSFFF